jgi:hypothetical protein
MVTRTITRDAADAQTVAGKVGKQQDAIEAAFEALAKELGVTLKSRPGDFAADVEALLHAAASQALGRDQAHGAQAKAHATPIDARDAAAGVLHGKVERFRDGLKAQYGEAVIAPVFARVPVHAAQLSTYTAQLLKALDKAVPTWKPLDEPGGTVDVPASVVKLTAALAALDAAIAAVTASAAGATTTFADRERAGALLHRLLIAGHGLGDGLLSAASLDTEAAHLITHHPHPGAAPAAAPVEPKK